jgi:hypothetical protein
MGMFISCVVVFTMKSGATNTLTMRETVDELETRKQKAIEVCMMDSSTIARTKCKKRRESGTIKSSEER